MASFGPPTIVMVGSGAGSVRREEDDSGGDLSGFDVACGGGCFFSAAAFCSDGLDMLPVVVTDCCESGPAEVLLFGRYLIDGMEVEMVEVVRSSAYQHT